MNENKDISQEILESLNTLNENSVITNNSIKELQEYFIIKDRQEQQEKETQKKQDEQSAKAEAEMNEQREIAEQSEKAEQTAKADAETETYTELLTDIRDQVTLSNEIMAGQLLFIGIITGILLAKIFIDRFMKL